MSEGGATAPNTGCSAPAPQENWLIGAPELDRVALTTPPGNGTSVRPKSAS